MIPELVLERVEASQDDGLIDAGTWDRVVPVTELLLARDGAPPRRATRVRAAASGRALHVRFECDGADSSATHVRRDAPLWEESAVELFVAAGDGAPARYVEIEVSPAGALFDAVVSNRDGLRTTMSVDPGWNAPGLVVRVARPRDGGWQAELALPWSALPDPRAGLRVWRANFYRIERPRGESAEYSAWSPTFADPPDFHKPARFGRLVMA